MHKFLALSFDLWLAHKQNTLLFFILFFFFFIYYLFVGSYFLQFVYNWSYIYFSFNKQKQKKNNELIQAKFYLILTQILNLKKCNVFEKKKSKLFLLDGEFTLQIRITSDKAPFHPLCHITRVREPQFWQASLDEAWPRCGIHTHNFQQ